MSAKAAIVRPINSHNENNNLNVKQWDLRSCIPCMHPGMVDQTDNDLSFEEEWNLLQTEQPDEENEESDDGDRFDNTNEANSQFSAQRAAVFEVEDACISDPSKS